MPGDRERWGPLFEAANPIFTRFGYRKTTVEEICREAGISKRTFYEGFRDKADFFGRMVIDLVMRFNERWLVASADAPDSRARVESLVDDYIRACETMPILQVIFEGEESRAAVEEIFSEENCKPLTQSLIPVLEAGMATGEFRAMDAERMTMILGTLLDSIFCILPQLFKKFPLVPDEPFVRELKAFIINGLLAHDRA